MKLRRLAIEHLPGIDRPFELTELADGLNIIVGPNGIGKSRLCAAMQALLWREHVIEDGRLAANALFDHDNAHWRVARDGSRYGWQRDGVDSDPPPLPGQHLHACFFLGLRDLLDDSDSAGKNLAGVIRRQMSGGFDLEAVRRRFEESVSTRVGRKESKAVSSAENEIRRAEQKQAGVARQEQGLDALIAQADDAERAQRRLVHYDTARSLHQHYGEHAQCERDLAALPEALRHLEGNELERIEKLDEHVAGKRGDREIANNALTVSLTAAHESRLDEPIASDSLATWRGRAESLAELERNLELAGQNARATHEALVSRRRALGGRANADATLAIEDDADLFAFLRESQKLATERETLTIRLAQLASHEFSDDDAHRLELLRRASESLRAWLRAPDPGLHATDGTLWPTRAHFLVVAVVLGAIGLALHFVVSLTSLAVATAGVGAGLAVAGLLARVRAGETRSTDWRAVAE